MLPSLPPRPNKKTTTYESPFLPLGIIQFPSLVAAGREEEEEERKRSVSRRCGQRLSDAAGATEERRRRRQQRNIRASCDITPTPPA